MSSVTWRKVIRDLWSNKPRALLVVLALVVGVVSVGTIAVAYSILPREMDKNYLATDPASATLWVQGVDDELVKVVAGMPGIARVEARSEIVGRYRVAEGEWRELWLYVVPDFRDIQLDKFTPVQGAWPPATGEMLLERTALGVANAKIGDKAVVKIPGVEARALTVAGTVHAPGLPPAWVESRVYGYVTPRTLELLGGGTKLGQLKMLVAEGQRDEDHIRQVAYGLKRRLERDGRAVSGVDVPVPGKHVHADLMAAFIAMLGAMGLLTLVTSSILVTTTISAVLRREIRQIGVMKAVGGDTRQIAGIYVVMVLVLGLAALAFGMPASMALGRALSRYEAMQMLNFEVFDYSVGPWVYILVFGVGLLIPLLAAAGPILKGSRITVVDALEDHGVDGRFGLGRSDRWLAGLRAGSRRFLLALRNASRRRGRLVLTLLTLAVAGANFLTALNVGASIDRALAVKFAATPYDIEVAFSRPYPRAAVERIAGNVDGVGRVEAWGGGIASVVMKDGTLGKKLRIIAPTAGSELTPKLRIIEGRWLRPDDRDTLVMSDAMMNKLGINARVGGEIALNVGGRDRTWRLVGISREFLAGGAYVPSASMSQTTGIPVATNIVARTDHGASADTVARNLEIRMDRAGFDVLTMWKTKDTRKVMTDHMAIITGILLVMAGLFVIVGLLGLASTMSMSILDRVRELGVMRAIGATPQDVVRIVVMEGTCIGAGSWVFAVLLSIPYTVLMGQVIAVFLGSPLDLAMPVAAWVAWLVVVLLTSALATAIPAWSASAQPVNKQLAYE